MVGGIGMSLDTVRQQLHSPSEDARFNAWMILYQASSENQEYQQERELVYQRKDPLLKISFIRFLSKISEERAVEYILRFFLDKNDQVIEAALKSFKASSYHHKLSFLIPFLKSPSEKIILFSLEEFSFVNLDAAFWPILQIVKSRNQHSKLVLCKALSALRHYPDTKSFSVIVDLLTHNDEEIRFLAYLVLGSLYEARFLPYGSLIENGLKDSSSRIRKSILWTLRRRPQKKYIQSLKEISLNDPDAQVRQEALQALGIFSDPGVVFHFIYIIENDENRMVALKAESVLRTLPVKKSVKAFWYMISRNTHHAALWSKKPLLTQKMKLRALTFLAEFQPHSKKILKYIISKLTMAVLEKETIPYFEALRLLDQPEVIGFLKPFLFKAPSISYMALKALIEVAETRKDYSVLIEYVKNKKIPLLHLQMILSFLAKYLPLNFIAELKPLFIEFLAYDITNIRYLSLQLLKPLLDEKVDIKFLLRCLRNEKDTEVRSFLEELLAEMCTDRFELWKQWVEFSGSQTEEVSTLSIWLKLFRITTPLYSAEKDLYALLHQLWNMHPSIDLREEIADFLGKNLAQKLLSWDLFIEIVLTCPDLAQVFPYLESKNLILKPDHLQINNLVQLKNIFLHSAALNEIQKKSFFHILKTSNSEHLLPLSIAFVTSKQFPALEAEGKSYLYQKLRCKSPSLIPRSAIHSSLKGPGFAGDKKVHPL